MRGFHCVHCWLLTTQPVAAASNTMKSKLWSLTLGNFAIGTGAMIVPGMLNELTADLKVSPAEVGLLISAFAMTICFGGPVLASLTSRIERRALLVASLSLYAVAHLAAAFAPGYASLMAIRILTAIGAALFTAQAAATASLMVPPHERGRAIALVFLGWSISAVLGMPLGSWLGAHLGWRPAIASVGALSALLAFAVWTQVPRGLYVAPMNRAAWRSLWRNRPLLLVVAVTAVQSAGQFTMLSYLALLLKTYLAATPTVISLMFACFGVAGVTGNLVGMRFIDRIGAARVAMVAMACMALAHSLWPLAQGSLWATAALVALWGLGCFSVNGSQQARLVGLAPALAPASVAMNSSALYLGQASGALAGGILIEAQAAHLLSVLGTTMIVVAMLMSQFAVGMSRRLGPAASTAS
ncbi:MAG: transporter [Paucimonas sp.]|nr:transporter [Paucimonas sp.]